jgi:hypothetical protein
MKMERKDMQNEEGILNATLIFIHYSIMVKKQPQKEKRQ